MKQNHYNRESFLMYCEFYEPTKTLPDADKAALYDAIFTYHISGEVLKLEEPTKTAFHFMRQQFDRNNTAYQAKCERLKSNGRKGGRPKKQMVIEKPNGLFENLKNQIGGDNDNDNDNDNSVTAYSLPANLNNPRFIRAWKDWEKHRKELKKRLTPSTAKMQLQTLAALPEVDAIATIEKSIECGWTGLFTEKTEPTTTKPRRCAL